MRPALPAGPYLVVGLARSGAAAAQMLLEHGEVIGCDSGSPEVPDGIEAHLETDGVELLDGVQTVVKSPGVPREAPVIEAALERGLEVTGELELAWRLLPNRFIAVTGTNGKTTTVELLGEMHRAAGIPVAVAGNVGTPLGSLVGAVAEDAVVVCECSSFQLEDSSAFAPECAVLLNLEPDHLDRHGDFERYREAKMRIFANQGPGGHRAEAAVRVAGGARGRPRCACAGRTTSRTRWPPPPRRWPPAFPRRRWSAALREFPGVPHRLEDVAEIGGVLYVNDSKATNVASAVRGIEAFEGGVHAILGGSLKGGGFEGLRDAVSARCRACYLIGEAGERLAEDLEGTVPLLPCGDLERAVEEASEAAVPGEVILLSPACASYDQYRDFEERGERFRSLVLSRE